jgi:hypothetical protein
LLWLGPPVNQQQQQQQPQQQREQLNQHAAFAPPNAPGVGPVYLVGGQQQQPQELRIAQNAVYGGAEIASGPMTMGQVVVRKGSDSTNEYDAWGGGPKGPRGPMTMGQVVVRKGSDSTNEYDAWGGGGKNNPTHFALATVNTAPPQAGTLRNAATDAPQPTQVVYAIPMEQPVYSTYFSLPTPTPVCAPGQQCDCGDYAATVHCNECVRNFCDACNIDGHTRGAKKDHVRVPIPVYSTYFSLPTDAAEYVAVDAGAVARGATMAAARPHYDLATGGDHNQNNVYDKWGGGGGAPAADVYGGGGAGAAATIRRHTPASNRGSITYDGLGADHTEVSEL